MTFGGWMRKVFKKDDPKPAGQGGRPESNQGRRPEPGQEGRQGSNQGGRRGGNQGGRQGSNQGRRQDSGQGGRSGGGNQGGRQGSNEGRRQDSGQGGRSGGGNQGGRQGQNQGRRPEPGQGGRPDGNRGRRPEANQGGRQERFSPPKVQRPEPKPREEAAPASGKKSEIFMEGQLQVKGRFGFLLSEDPSIPDVYIGPDTLRLAMPGDRVMARVRIIAGGVRPEGDIVRVLKRARSTMVGVCESTDKGDVIRPEMGTTAVRIIDRGGLQFGAGDALVVRISTWPTMDRPAEGAVIEVLGKPDDAGVDMVMIIRKNELNESFPPDVVREASAFGTEVPESALAGRETFFHLPVVTIDGEDAQDFDDAVSLESAPDGGWKLGVHIADVAHYVREGTALDEEALKRATSVYMPGKVIPMLPPNLSDHLCSLRPNVLRLTLSCIMELAADGRVTGSRIVKSAIRSSRRFTYEEVETILRNQGTAGASPEIVRDVEAMGKLARILRERRIKRGALDLDFPEAKIVLDVRGRPIDARRRTRLESHRLVEELMLLANESVAELMKEKPFLYRIHERPAPEKLGKLSQTLKAYDVPVPPDFEKGNSLSLQKTLKAVVGSPIEAVIHMMCLRSLMKAIYSPVNVGHYGLASPCYTHFTSPIRRYPDLCIHRIIAEWLISPLSPERQSHWKLALPEIAKRSSFRERLAQETERESLELNRVQLMKERVGETFDGIIMGVAPFGFFVQLDEIFVEGMVPVASLSDDYYVYDEVRATLKGRRTGRVFLMGQKVRVRLAAANAAKRQLEFAYGDGPSKDVRAGAHKPHGGGGRRRRGR